MLVVARTNYKNCVNWLKFSQSINKKCNPEIISRIQVNLKVVAEGVETKEQFELLKSIDCDYFQGYYFAKPQKDILKILKLFPSLN